MIWEARTTSVRDLIEAKIAVAQSSDDYSYVGHLMMHPDEWQDYTSRLGLKQGDGGVWRSS
jgi:hypothetical protein